MHVFNVGILEVEWLQDKKDIKKGLFNLVLIYLTDPPGNQFSIIFWSD